jgi:hypothetical protein
MTLAQKNSKGLNPAAFDDIALTGDGAAIIGRQKEHQSGYFFGLDHSFESLPAQDLCLVSAREP